MDGKAVSIQSNKTVIAIPPRLAMQSITFSPPLCSSRTNELNSMATWMAGQAKVVALYDTPFWNQQGLSGDVISQRGPLHEIHDASPHENGPYALFGFVKIPTQFRQGKEPEIIKSALHQLARLFGEQALTPIDTYIKDWAFDPFTATQTDQHPPEYHSSYSMQQHTETAWDNRIIWSGSETANAAERINGYLEGAMDASIRTLQILEASSS